MVMLVYVPFLKPGRLFGSTGHPFSSSYSYDDAARPEQDFSITEHIGGIIRKITMKFADFIIIIS